MSVEEVCAPDAALMESIRAVGYSLPTAIADIVDNSIAAEAKVVEVCFSGGESPYITVFDDGTGMSHKTLRVAMRLAGHARKIRSDKDLGRFGLGLKTASLSQCRCLTVISKHEGSTQAVSWDLDHLSTTGEWTLLALDPAEVAELPNAERLNEVSSGTLVVWTKLDRIAGSETPGAENLDAEMVEVNDHLSLVFHQFLSHETVSERLALSINGRIVEPADPFLTASSRTQKSPVESIELEGAKIDVQAYTLPYLNKMTTTERKRARVHHGLQEAQGFYVYRGGRLVVWGTWFRLMPKLQSSKLTRVKVDVPNSLDYLWSLDIKKSVAVPPHALRDRLRALAITMVQPSKKVHLFRGRKAASDDSLLRLWDVIVDRDSFRYEINRDHPIINSIQQGLDQMQLSSIDQLLNLLESTFPAQDLHNRMSADKTTPELNVSQEDHLLSAALVWRSLGATSDLSTFIQKLILCEPWNTLSDRASEFEDSLKRFLDRDPV